MSETKKGSCHCGAVQFEVDAALDTGAECNCSMCGRSGTVLAFVPASQFRLISGAEALTDYQFAKKHIHHTFCKVCGIKPFAKGTGPGGTDVVAVNLRCVEGLDVRGMEKKFFDGKSL